GVLTEERKAALRAHKENTFELLDEQKATETVTADPGARREPFRLTDVQTACLPARLLGARLDAGQRP
ncbi:hypothetical protein ABZZ80_27880, partial [Streptomyces sp. NPDC006356]